jgi:hypothetical protein
MMLLLGLLSCCACGSTDTAPGGPDASASDAGNEGGAIMGQVELGVPGGPDSLDFAPLVDGMVLPLETFGQGGTHVLLGVRCVGFGQRAFVSLRVPITMMMSGIAQNDAERDGLAIEISAEVLNSAGVTGRATAQATLSTADL